MVGKGSLNKNTPANHVSIFLLMLLLIATCGCAGGDVSPPTGIYEVSIGGMDNFIGGNSTEIAIPDPMMNGEPLFTDTQIASGMRDRSAWSSRIEMTERGSMIAFKTEYGNLSNITFNSGTTINKWANKSISKRRVEATGLMENPLSPSSNESRSNFTRPVKEGSILNYTSFIYIDKNVHTTDDQSHTIMVDIRLTIFEGQSGSEYGSRHYAYIEEAIPSGVTGWIPVTVQVT